MKFTDEEYRKKIADLHIVARELLANNTPDKVLEMAAGMDPVDAYILGRIIGCELQASQDMKAFMRAISAAEQMMRSIMNRREGAADGYVLN